MAKKRIRKKRRAMIASLNFSHIIINFAIKNTPRIDHANGNIPVHTFKK